jgi:hypothetical protein
MCRSARLATVAAVACFALAAVVPAHADPPVCLKRVVKQLLNFQRVVLKNHEKCLSKENKGGIPGPCPDNFADWNISMARFKVVEKIADKCTMDDLAALGYRTDCAYEPATTGIEGQCAALPVTTPAEFAECLRCWKGAEMAEYVALLYASHANEVCGGSLDETSPVCSDLDCTIPLPEQRDLGDNAENDCQRRIGQAGIKYLLKRAKILEKCLLDGGTRESCLGDPFVQLDLAKAETSKQTKITDKCGNRNPSPTSSFCCRCGPMGGVCTTVPQTREECLADPSCDVQEGKTCNTGDGRCDPAPKQITWWAFCPESDTCPGTALTTLDDLIACVDSSADTIVDEVLCLQFPQSYPCASASPDPTSTVTPTPEVTPTP